MKNYYKILGIEKDADVAIIKKAYKTLAKKFHPDLNKNSSAQAKFIEITEAYKVLSDDFEKIKYDQLYYVQLVNNSEKTPSKKSGNGKKIDFVYYRYYAYAFLFFLVLIVSYNQFKPKPIIEFEELTNFNTKKTELNLDKIIDTPKKINQVVIIQKEQEKIVIRKTKPTNRQLAYTNTKSNLNIKPINKDFENIEKNKLVLDKKPIHVLKKQVVINNKEELISSGKKNKKQVALNELKNQKPFRIYNDINNNETNTINIIAKDIVVAGLQHIKGSKYKTPKKIKKTDSFKVAVKFINNGSTKIKDKVKMMLVILNSEGKTLKINVKDVDFSEKNSAEITFYEKFKDRLIIDEEYRFLFYVNKRLITQTKKTF